MGFFSFLKNAGEKVFGGGSSNDEKATAIKKHLEKFNLPTTGLEISVDDEKATLKGELASATTKSKMMATAGNVEGISEVVDNLKIAEIADVDIPDVSETFYTIEKGDTLWAIAEKTLGNGSEYTKIVELNSPSPIIDPDKIYPGQVIVIPGK